MWIHGDPAGHNDIESIFPAIPVECGSMFNKRFPYSSFVYMLVW